MTLFAAAAWAGVTYVAAGVALALAVVAALALPWSPLILAGPLSLAAVTLGVYLIRAGRLRE
jgi:hypothetical protein